MNVSPVQSNSQSFDMAFYLKGDGARKLATLLEDSTIPGENFIKNDVIDVLKI